MKVLLKITQEKFKNEVLTNKNLKTHGDIVLKNPYRQGASPRTRRLARITLTVHQFLRHRLRDHYPRTPAPRT
jgi:hypothetical protein